jgi:predicted kinase
MGVAGSGKTTLSKEIVKRISAVYLDNNHIVDAFFPHTRNGAAYRKLRPHFYRALYTITEENLKLGNNVLLDVPHIKEIQDPNWRAFIKRLAARARAKLVVIRCFCSDAVLRSRLKCRGATRDAWKLSHWQAFLAEQPTLRPIPFPHLDIDTERNLASNVNAALHYAVKTGFIPHDRVRDSARTRARTRNPNTNQP